MESLKAFQRDSKQNAQELRAKGNILAVVYGQGKEALSVFVKQVDFDKIYQTHTQSKTFHLDIEGEKSPFEVLVTDIQQDILKNHIIHIDFYRIDPKTEVKALIPIHLIGEAPAVKAKGGVLIQQIHEVKISCLPKDLISEIVYDVSSLSEFGTKVTIKDLSVASEVKVLRDPNDLVLSVSAPRKSATMSEGGAPASTQSTADASKTNQEATKNG